jgi:hypothetical protein
LDVQNTSQSLSSEDLASLNQREILNCLVFRNQFQVFPLGTSYSPSLSVNPDGLCLTLMACLLAWVMALLVFSTMPEMLMQFIKSCNNCSSSNNNSSYLKSLKSLNIPIQFCFSFMCRKK